MAALRAEGDDPAELLALIDAVPASSQWRRAESWTIALEQRVTRTDDGGPRVVIASLDAQVSGLRLHLTLPAVAGITAEVELDAPGFTELPDDLLAVLGGGWSSLWRLGDRWRGQFRAPRREPARSEAALAQVQRAAEHRRARWPSRRRAFTSARPRRAGASPCGAACRCWRCSG
ncbi:hypothetical protein FSC37_06390 [Piscinibacter aquaticus]|uniref:Uncharacterized protein n=1 Tax=Piscinibacter aquaticus TaxID=392597 RepID=A0A5C6U203_9BURK|nr:hypothetical protein FSC37_06390 [Piscinibacter aquaticus]